MIFLCRTPRVEDHRQSGSKNGRTPRCRACRLRGLPADKAWHTQKCRDRYAAFVRNSFEPSRANLDQAPLEDEGHGVGDIGGDFDHDLGLDAPDDPDPLPRVLPDDVNPEDMSRARLELTTSCWLRAAASQSHTSPRRA